VLTGLLHGFEATTRLGMSVGPAHYRIWHNTATCGPFGSAMAAAHLIGLDEDQAVHALGNAGSQAAGLWEFLETGAETKHLHAGRGAEAGVVAAGLAAHGFTGAPKILEGERGLWRAACPDSVPQRLLGAPDAPWQVHLTSIKPWPSCRHTHPAIACAGNLHEQMKKQVLHTDSIEKITVFTYQAAIDLCDRVDPQSPYAAKFSLQHCVAAALSDPQVRFASFEADARARLAGLRQKVEVAIGADQQAAYPAHWGTRIAVRFGDGRQLEAATSDALGDPEAPVAREGLIAKAEELMAHAGWSAPDGTIAAILAMAEGGPLPDLLAGIDRQA
jgi:2-methylcitrate dehydratase PrpD